MKKKDFFRILVKLIGLYWIVITLYSQLPFIISMLFKEFNSAYVPYTLSCFVVSVLLFVLMVFYTDKIISWFKLDLGFDEDRIEFSNIHVESILKMA